MPNASLKIKSDILLGKLKRLSPAIISNERLPILRSVLIKDRRISVTNLELTILEDIDTDENLIIPFKPLYNILTELGSEEVVVTQSDTDLILTSPSSGIFSFGKPVDIDEYPMPNEVSYEGEINVGEMFFNSMRNASKHESQDSHLTIHGINISSVDGCIDVAGTDGRTIFVSRYPIEGVNISAHIDSSFCAAIQDFETALLSFSQKFISCKKDGREVRIQFIELKFPDYSQFMPKEVETNCVLDRKELESAIRKCLVFGSETKKIEFTFGEESVSLSHRNEFNQSADVSISAMLYEISDGHKICLSGELIQRCLSCLPEDCTEVNMAIPENPTRPVYIQEQNDLILIAPMQS